MSISDLPGTHYHETELGTSGAWLRFNLEVFSQ